jgi:hypothetical protein
MTNDSQMRATLVRGLLASQLESLSVLPLSPQGQTGPQKRERGQSEKLSTLTKAQKQKQGGKDKLLHQGAEQFDSHPPNEGPHLTLNAATE